MTPYVPTWKERWEDAKSYAMPAVAVFMVLALAGWVAWHEWGPRGKLKPKEALMKDTASREMEQARVSADVDAIEKKINARSKRARRRRRRRCSTAPSPSSASVCASIRA